MNLRVDLLPAKSMRRSGLLLKKAVFGVAHDTGNERSTAAQNVKYYKRTANKEHASAHFFVDDKEVVECIPVLSGAPEKAWHVRYQCTYDNKTYGVDANDCAIGVELCYGENIDPEKAYYNYVELWATLCKKFNWNPLKHICTHAILDPKRRTDPVNAFQHDNFAGSTTFAKFQQDVADFMAGKYGIVQTATFILPDSSQITGIMHEDKAHAPAREFAEKFKKSISFGSDKILKVGGKQLDYIMPGDGITYVHIRSLAPVLDLRVTSWDEATHTALIGFAAKTE